jgi:hypothetical protein
MWNKEEFAEGTTFLTDLCFVLVSSEHREICVFFPLPIKYFSALS